ncbi:MAG: hypothetical protein ACI9KE_005680 [Polyangiales bacterium]|jgi:hypothetical protein
MLSRAFLPFVFCLLAACDCSSTPDGCLNDDECSGGLCVDGLCTTPGDAANLPDMPTIDAGADVPQADVTQADIQCPLVACGDVCCAEGERCAPFGCVINLGECIGNDDCRGDSYCDEGFCTPYGMPPEITNDPECEREIVVGAFEPAVQCEWNGEGAPMPTWSAVYSAPMVADFNLNDDPDVLAPSLVFTSFASSADGGVLRIVDGRSCDTLITLEDPADRLIYASNSAIGDLDGDGSTPEIVATSLVAAQSAGGLIAFARSGDTFERRWYGRNCELPGEPRHIVNDWTNNNGPSIHDLDDDGVPEILFGRFVYNAQGCVLNPTQSYDNYLRLGAFAVVADVDNDGAPELAYADGVYDWLDNDWLLASDWAPTDVAEATRFGHVAIGDFGDFGAAGDLEIVVSAAPELNSNQFATGIVRVMTRTGEIVFGPFELPGVDAGRGGPPTIGDFDGDGRAEFAVAGGSRYTVFDLDCDIDGDTAPGCERVPGLPRGVLWSRPSQDFSSNVTGSSVFDFDADGVAEVVYGDECFLRIYRGTDGEVLYSQSASSGTGYELPIIADVDGDFNSEIVVAMTTNTNCPAQDPIFDGESLFESNSGVVVLRDATDRWAASRPIWNQHAYAVTNVNDDGSIPRTSEWVRNSDVEGLNNFRMNAQGDLERTGAADLTVALDDDICGAEGETNLTANVCNRGTNPVPDGARVVFYDGDPDDGAAIACETSLPRLLGVAECTAVSCPFTIADGESPEIVVVVDPDEEVFECRSGNNRGVIPAVLCGPI